MPDNNNPVPPVPPSKPAENPASGHQPPLPARHPLSFESFTFSGSPQDTKPDAPAGQPAPAPQEAPQPQAQNTEKAKKFVWNKKTKIIVISLSTLMLIDGTLMFQARARRHAKTPAHSKPSVAVRKTKPPVVRPLEARANKPLTEFNLQLKGNKEFEKQVMQSLQLLWEHDNPTFEDVKKYIYTIRAAQKTDFVLENDIPTVLLSKKTVLRSQTWCAGAIAHQLFHAYQHYEKKKQTLGTAPPPPPGQEAAPEQQSGLAAYNFSAEDSLEKIERQADLFQITVMKKIGAPPAEIRQLRKRPEGDYSLTHDGK